MPAINHSQLIQPDARQRMKPENARRILVTGNAGSGKTSFSAQLVSLTGLPYVGLDLVVWQRGWLRTPTAERQRQENNVADDTAWIVDGVSMIILGAADLVIFLDFPRLTCLWRALRRNVRYLFQSRPGLPENCPEIRIVATLLKIIWRFPKQVRPRILQACAHHAIPIIHVRDNQDLVRCLASFDIATVRIAQQHNAADESSIKHFTS